jgi:GMP synthase PP-ATPase subunit
MNKKQFENETHLKELNKFLKSNGASARMIAEKNQFNDYQLKWQHDGGTLPETLAILKVAKPLKERFYKELREEQIKAFLKD